jgi:hypothetical protein
MTPVGEKDGNVPVGDWDGLVVGCEGAWDTEGRVVGDALVPDGREEGAIVELTAGSRIQ